MSNEQGTMSKERRTLIKSASTMNENDDLIGHALLAIRISGLTKHQGSGTPDSRGKLAGIISRL